MLIRNASEILTMNAGLGVLKNASVLIENGKIKTPNLATYTIPTSLDIPQVEVIIVEAVSKDGPFGAKGVGEQPIIPTAAAVANAIYHATGIRVRRLPIGPEILRRAVLKKETGNMRGDHR